jgi:hypothetical protein
MRVRARRPSVATMVSTTDRQARILESRKKICTPAKLDDSMCFYCPQDNVDALRHPRVRKWLKFVQQEYVPPFSERNGASKKLRRILLLLPCTKTKPYLLSSEHLHINASLLKAGFRAMGGETLAREFSVYLPLGFSPEVLSIAPLRRGNVVVHRAVMSEPLVFVPYEHVVSCGGKPSPACAYDDPGLFENRGNAVSPWRKDFSGVAISKKKWRWGDEERRAYVAMHNEMSGRLAKVISRLRPYYSDVVAWVAPGLTHRSFVLAGGQRGANGVAATRRVGDENLPLQGANDLLAPEERIECLPTPQQCAAAKQKLAKRLGRRVSAIGGYYSRGGSDATPLALPEMLQFLTTRLKEGS